MRSSLSPEDLELLRESIDRHRPDLRTLVDDVVGGRRLSVDEANELRDAIADEIVTTGMDADVGAVNERGKRLDRLIDRIAQLSDLDLDEC
jgi:hypothetical protein